MARRNSGRKFETKLRSISILVVLITAGVAAPGQSRETREQIQAFFAKCLSSEAAAYSDARNNILARGIEAAPFLESKLQSQNVNERVLARAMLSWIDKSVENRQRAGSLQRLVIRASRMHSAMVRSVPIVALDAHGPGLEIPRKEPAAADDLHDEGAVPFLLEACLKGCVPDSDAPCADATVGFWARCAAAVLAGVNRGEDVIPVLSSLLTDKRFEIRACAALGLGRVKDSKAAELLIGALADENSEVRSAVRGSLVKATGQDFGENKKAYEEWWSTNKYQSPTKP
ncbi:MAG TPA: HEAT repeat domain-containing protein [Candidatus Dormibacteraeota bacterium]|nr:HEAT repeat domain-containing protein [Candidatus Dormibacteraeota bacterium]